MGHESEILDLICSSPGKPAPYITEQLSIIGNGSMADGVSSLFTTGAICGAKYKSEKDFIMGIILGSLSTLAIFGSVKVALNLHQKRIERIAALQEVDVRMKSADAETESTQTDEVLSCCEENIVHQNGKEA